VEPTLPCPHCGIALKVGSTLAGKLIRCPACQVVFTGPPEAPSPPVAVAVPMALAAPATPTPMISPPPENPGASPSRPTKPARPRGTNWEQVRLGFDLVISSVLVSLVAVGLIVVGAITTKNPKEAVPFLVFGQIIGLIAGFMQVYGQSRICAVPVSAGRGICLAATALYSVSFALSMMQFLLALLASSPATPSVPKPVTEPETATALTWTILGASAGATVFWLFFLPYFALFCKRPGVALLAVASMLTLFGYVFWAVYRLLGVATGPTRARETALDSLPPLLVGAVAVISLYMAVLIIVRNLIVVDRPRSAAE
jgi:hypothetical protein